MVTYMKMPQTQIVVDSTTYTNDQNLVGKVTRFENGFDQATLHFSDSKASQRSTLITGSVISIGVKDKSDATYTNLLSGVTRYRTESFPPETINLKIDGVGYMLAECLCGQEYGTQSSNPTIDTLQEIVTDSTYGVVPKWVLKILNTTTNSGYALDTTYVENITGTINYLYFPYKPSSKSICDLCNLVQAIKGASTAGPHWIVTRESGTTYLRIKAIDASQTGWTKYYGNSQANATLSQGVDFLTENFQTLSTEANYVLYHSPFSWPGNQDYYTETGSISNFDTSSRHCDVAYVTGGARRGNKYVEFTTTAVNPDQSFAFSFGGLDITKAGGKYNYPTFNFSCRRDSTYSPSTITIYFYDTSLNIEIVTIDVSGSLATADMWTDISFPIGPYATPYQDKTIVVGGNIDWSDLQSMAFYFGNNQASGCKFGIDGLNISGYVLRGAYNSTNITANGVKQRIINDPFGKDDSLIASDDSGQAARSAAAELYRLQTTPIVGTITVPMIKDLLPGQWLHIQAKPNSSGTYQIDTDMRVTQVTHDFSFGPAGFTSTIALTSDLINSFARQAYDSQNEITKAQRPEFQDRQSTGIKMRDIDITQPILAKDYA